MICGYPEIGFYNSALILDREGKLLLNTRKKLLFEADKKWCNEGDKFNFIDLKNTEG